MPSWAREPLRTRPTTAEQRRRVDKRVVGDGLLSSHCVISGVVMTGMPAGAAPNSSGSPAPSAAALGHRPEDQRPCGLYCPASLEDLAFSRLEHGKYAGQSRAPEINAQPRCGGVSAAAVAGIRRQRNKGSAPVRCAPRAAPTPATRGSSLARALRTAHERPLFHSSMSPGHSSGTQRWSCRRPELLQPPGAGLPVPSLLQRRGKRKDSMIRVSYSYPWIRISAMATKSRWSTSAAN